MDEPRTSDTDWSQSEREKQVYYCVYMKSRKMVLMNLVENGLVDTAEEGESVTNWERSTDTDTLAWVKHWEVAIPHREPSLVLYADLKGWDAGGERGSRDRGVCVLSCFTCVWLYVTPWTVNPQTPLSMEFSRQEYWRELPHLPPGDLPHPGIQSACYVSCTGR